MTGVIAQNVFAHWTLTSVIAVGGVGEVWRAVRDDPRGEAVVALKRLHSHLMHHREMRAQFALEQRLTTGLPRHPHLVRAVEADEVEGRPYVALVLAPGHDLRRRLARPPGLPRGEALAIVAAAADAAAHLHRFGFVHGDINPGNLVVDDPADTLHVTLVDLGIARKIGEAGGVRGTHAYMAPEQVRGGAWTAATDVFALGVVLWELVTGKRLFHRGPPWLTQAAVIDDEAPPTGDPGVDAITTAALAKDPAARLASAGELADRVRALLA
ncbi:MAG TPA: serine/threonine-protein kinase [Kofleriaceae bacterium]|nr:serine/threonine-protein kinase [Kofleriaceae bacterium]